MGNDFFDELGVTLSKTAKELTEKAESLYESQKIRGKISAEKRAAEKVLADLGKLLYKRYTEGEELDEEVKELCAQVDAHKERLSKYKEELAGKKGKKICPACQKEVDLEVVYCPYCGSPCPGVKKGGEEADPKGECAGEASAEEDSAQEASAEEDSAEEASAEEDSAVETPAEEDYAQEVSVKEDSVEEAPADKVSEKEAPAEEECEKEGSGEETPEEKEGV